MSKMTAILQDYANRGIPFAAADSAVESSLDKRERFEDDELDDVSIHCAYLDGIKESGWTQVDYEYVYARTTDDDPTNAHYGQEMQDEQQYPDPTFNEYEYICGQEYAEEGYPPADNGPSYALGGTEAGGGALVYGEG